MPRINNIGPLNNRSLVSYIGRGPDNLYHDIVYDWMDSHPDLLYEALSRWMEQHSEIVIPDGSITSSKLADGSITTSKLADDSVTANKVADYSIGTDKIDNLAITEAKIALGAVTAARIASASIINAHMINGCVSERVLADGSVSEDKLASQCVTGAKIRTDEITGYHIKERTINACLQFNELTQEVELRNNIGYYDIDASNLSDDAVITGKIRDGNVTLPKLDDDMISFFRINVVGYMRAGQAKVA